MWRYAGKEMSGVSQTKGETCEEAIEKGAGLELQQLIENI